MTGKTISVVVPCYNEGQSVIAMYDRLTAVFENSLPSYNFEIIYADDFSSDDTRDLIRELAKKDSRVKGVFNARNFGFHRNVFSSLTYGSGDATFLLFGDLQDPPENLPEFVVKWEEGAKVVIGQRRSSDEGFVMRTCRRAYYTLIDWFADTPQIDRFTGYGLYDVQFIDILRQIGDTQPFFKAVVAEYGIDLAVVTYDQAQSARGKSNFNFLKNYDFAMQGITASTKLLMRLATFIAAAIGVICLVIALFVLGRKLVDWNAYPVGEASRTVGMFFLGAIQLFFIGILGEYILSINSRMGSKPRVVVGERLNFDIVPEEDGARSVSPSRSTVAVPCCAARPADPFGQGKQNGPETGVSASAHESGADGLEHGGIPS